MTSSVRSWIWYPSSLLPSGHVECFVPISTYWKMFVLPTKTSLIKPSVWERNAALTCRSGWQCHNGCFLSGRLAEWRERGTTSTSSPKVKKRHHIVIGLVNQILLVPSEKQFIDSPTTLLNESTKALQLKSLSYKQPCKNSIITKKITNITEGQIQSLPVISGHGWQLGGTSYCFIDTTKWRRSIFGCFHMTEIEGSVCPFK